MPNDYPIPVLVVGAEAAIAEMTKQGVPAVVYFKATCPTCGDRPMFAEPNRIYDEMECCTCGTTFAFEKGNYLLVAGAAADLLSADTANHTVAVVPHKALGATRPGRPTRQYQEPAQDYMERLKRWLTVNAPDELSDTLRSSPQPTSWTCPACRISWPYDPELAEPKLFCPNCGTQVEAV